MRLEPKEEGMRWLLQAEQDLDDARYSFQGKRFNLACFLSQQAAEKAVKAFIYAQGEEIVLGHSVAHLLKHALRYDPDLEEILRARGLDKYYIPTRYPNGLPGGLPFEAFDEADASKAIGMAARVVERMESAMRVAQE
jgi:HEPN domain-containing protein